MYLTLPWNILALAGGGLLHVAMAIAGIFAVQNSESGIASMGRRRGDSLHDDLDGTVFACIFAALCLAVSWDVAAVHSRGLNR